MQKNNAQIRVHKRRSIHVTNNVVANFLQLLVLVLKQEVIISCNNNYFVTTIATVTGQRQSLIIGRSAHFFIEMTTSRLKEFPVNLESSWRFLRILVY